MSNVKNNAAAQETCRKLIDAAGEVFAERGLHAATIKEITDRAGVNTAAVNYHFSDKFELYSAVIRHALSLTPVAPSPEQRAGSPKNRLRAFITDLMNDLSDPTRPQWRVTVLAHEFAQPTAALNAVMDELMRPRSELLHSIIRDILGPGMSETQVTRASLSVASQCLTCLYSRQLVHLLHPGLLDSGQVQELARHITEFSLAGLRAMRRSARLPHKRSADLAVSGSAS